MKFVMATALLMTQILSLSASAAESNAWIQSDCSKIEDAQLAKIPKPPGYESASNKSAFIISQVHPTNETGLLSTTFYVFKRPTLSGFLDPDALQNLAGAFVVTSVDLSTDKGEMCLLQDAQPTHISLADAKSRLTRDAKMVRKAIGELGTAYVR